MAASTSSEARNGGRPEATELKPRLGRLRLVFFVSQLGWSVPGTASGTLLQQLAAELDPRHKVAVYATAGTVGALAASIIAVTGGALSDRVHARLGTRAPLILGGALVATLAFAGTAVVHSPAGLIAAAALYQVGLGVMLGSVSALLPEYVRSEMLGRVSAAMGVGVLLGQVLGGVSGGLLVTNVRTGFLILPWPLLISALMVLGLLRGLRTSHAPGATPEPDEAATSGAPEADAVTVRGPWWRIGDATFWWIFIARALFILGLYMATQYLLFTLTDHLHLSSARAGQILSISSVLFAVTSTVFILVSGSLSDRLKRRKPFVAGGSLLVTVGSVPMLLHPSVIRIFAFVVLGGAAFGAYIAVDQALMVDALPTAGNNARDLGILGAATSLPGAFAPAAAGLAVTSVGYSGLFAVVAVIEILGAVCLLGVRRLK
ncbi:MFS transporter [Streptomyces nodosus]|uniref:MFS transporter n=1 Tax=Streptomyces nodosus TaxID=40318 RepID=UPI0034561545